MKLVPPVLEAKGADQFSFIDELYDSTFIHAEDLVAGGACYVNQTLLSS